MGTTVREIDDRLAAKYGSKTPMYVEYPHKSYWKPNWEDAKHRRALSTFFGGENTPTLLYIHLLHCQKQCYFCTCRTEITTSYSDVTSYLDLLFREVDLYSEFFDREGLHPNIKEIHLGGGTPTFMNEADFDRLMEKVGRFVDFKQLSEFSIEIDPRRIKKDRMEFYARRGINRISFGVQDFDIDVQKAVNRVQPPELIERLLTPDVRALFPHGVNFDIICGLPRQTTESIRKTMRRVAEMGPDRVCLNYLDLAPTFHPHQLLMPQDSIPGHSERKQLFLAALEVMESTGYVRTGYDHFAKPTDDVARALEGKTAHWNSMGSTPGRCLDHLGVGAHSYSRLGTKYYSQNVYEVSDYEKALAEGHFPLGRGRELTDDDVIRRDVILSLRIYFQVDFSQIERKHAIQFKDYFKNELLALDELASDGLVDRHENSIVITEIGRQFANHVCQRFDAYQRQERLSS